MYSLQNNVQEFPSAHPLPPTAIRARISVRFTPKYKIIADTSFVPSFLPLLYFPFRYAVRNAAWTIKRSRFASRRYYCRRAKTATLSKRRRRCLVCVYGRISTISSAVHVASFRFKSAGLLTFYSRAPLRQVKKNKSRPSN